MNNNSKPFSLNSADAFRSLALGVALTVVVVFQQMLTTHGFDFASYDWAMILNVAITAALTQLGINFASNPERQIEVPLVGAVSPKEPNA
jgi:hypothetical protein